MKKLVLTAGALSLAAAPALAQSVPVVAPIADENSIGGEGSAGVIAAALIAGIVAIAVIAFADDDDDSAVSP